jgi:hypothetical protein
MSRSFGSGVSVRLRPALRSERARRRNPLGPGYDHADDRELLAKSKAGVDVRDVRHVPGNDTGCGAMIGA